MKISAKILTIFTLSILLSALVVGNVAFADTEDAATPPEDAATTESENGSAIKDKFEVDIHLKAPGQVSKVSGGLSGFAVDVIELMIKLIGGVALVVFMIGGILVIVAQGKEDMLERGKSAMLYAIIGLVVAFFSFIIVSFVQSILFK